MYTLIPADPIHETSRAVLLDAGDRQVWVPKSCLRNWTAWESCGQRLYCVKKWFAYKSGLSSPKFL